MAGMTPEPVHCAWDLSCFPLVPWLHIKQPHECDLFISGSKAPQMWVDAGLKLQATRKLSSTCRNLTLPQSLSTSWWGERWGKLVLIITIIIVIINNPSFGARVIHVSWHQLKEFGDSYKGTWVKRHLKDWEGKSNGAWHISWQRCLWCWKTKLEICVMYEKICVLG